MTAARITTLLVCTIATFASMTHAQQFDEDTNPRLPAPSPFEYSEQVDFADVDNDGDLDMLFANGSGFAGPQQQQTNRLYINNGSGVFTDESADQMPNLAGFTRDVDFGDVDRDGDLDLIIVNTFNTQSWLFINDGAGTFTDETDDRLPTANFSGSDADFGDVDNDGDLDLIFTNTGTSAFGTGLDRLYLNDGDGVFTNASSQLPGTAVAQSIDCSFVDIDGDLDLDLVMAHRDARSQLWRNDGAGHFSDITLANLPNDGNGTYSIDNGDIDGDGDLDLFVVRGSTELVYQNDGTGDFSNITSSALPINPFQDDNDGDFVDVDNDGDLDFVIARLGSGGERFYINNGSGVMTRTNGMITIFNDSSLDIEIGDLDGDGARDIVTAQGESGSFRNRVYMNTGPADTRPPTFHNLENLADTDNVADSHIVRVSIRDGMTGDRNFFAQETVLRYRVDAGDLLSTPLHFSGGDLYRAEIPAQPAGVTVTCFASATDFAGNTGQSANITFDIGPDFADPDNNNVVNLLDVNAFNNCVTGPEGKLAGNCAVFDADADNDIDYNDYAALQRLFNSE